jgi:hypothetical protein
VAPLEPPPRANLKAGFPIHKALKARQVTLSKLSGFHRRDDVFHRLEVSREIGLKRKRPPMGRPFSHANEPGLT